MTRCLRVRVGQAAYLAPAENVGAIALYRLDQASTDHRRVIDARRMTIDGVAATAKPTDEAVAVEWMDPLSQSGCLVLVDEVEGLIEIDPEDISEMPDPMRGLAVLFDGFWHDKASATFLLRLRVAKLSSFFQMRRLACLLAPLSAVRKRRHVDG